MTYCVLINIPVVTVVEVKLLRALLIYSQGTREAAIEEDYLLDSDVVGLGIDSADGDALLVTQCEEVLAYLLQVIRANLQLDTLFLDYQAVRSDLSHRNEVAVLHVAEDKEVIFNVLNKFDEFIVVSQT